MVLKNIVEKGKAFATQQKEEVSKNSVALVEKLKTSEVVEQGIDFTNKHKAEVTKKSNALLNKLKKKDVLGNSINFAKKENVDSNENTETFLQKLKNKDPELYKDILDSAVLLHVTTATTTVSDFLSALEETFLE